MAEKPNWRYRLLLGIGVVVGLLVGIWLVLDHSLRAPPVTRLLLQDSPSALARSISGKHHSPNTVSFADMMSQSHTREIDCSDTDRVKEQISTIFDENYGTELTEAFLSGANDWSERHPPDIAVDSSSNFPFWISAPGSYSRYSDETLQAVAANGDALASALYGARITARVTILEIGKPSQQQMAIDLATAERYLWEGARGQIRGALSFLWDIAEFRVDASRLTQQGDKHLTYPDRRLVIELYAQTLINQTFGSFEERMKAHVVLIGPEGALIPPLLDVNERQQAVDRARELLKQHRLNTVSHDSEEQRAENAAVAIITKMYAEPNPLEQIRCTDGRTLDQVISPDQQDELLDRYQR